MDTERNKQMIRRLFEDAWNGRKLDLLPEVLVPDYAERERNWAEIVFVAFPDTQFTIEDMVAEDDRVATRVVWRATHQGAFDGLAPTGKRVELPAMFIHRIEAGKAAEVWGFAGGIDIVKQIKALIASE